MDAIDLHRIRSKLKLVHDDGPSTIFENRGGVACPVCGAQFDEVLETTERTRQIEPDEPLSFCIVNEESRLLLFTHR